MNRNNVELEHRRAWEAIPWVVNGSASEVQSRLVEAHAHGCESCRAELACQRKLHASMAQESPTVTDPDVGLQRLLKRIDQADDDSSKASAIGVRPPVRRPRTGALVYGLTFALVVESIGISVLGMGLLSRTGQTPSYQVLSDAATFDARATIRIVPAPAMNLGDLQRLLQGLELQVVAGPNEAGAYALAPMSGRPDLGTQVARLRAAPGMRLVEPIRARATAQ